MARLILRRKLVPKSPHVRVQPGELCSFGDLEVGDWFVDLSSVNQPPLRKDTPDTYTVAGYKPELEGNIYNPGLRRPMSIKAPVRRLKDDTAYTLGFTKERP